MPLQRRLFASIHDVAPSFEREVDQLLEILRPHVGDRVALLVVPNHWRRSPIVPRSPFAARLRERAEAGFEIFLHGMYHQDDAEHRGPVDRLRARWMTAGEAEFLGLTRKEASDRISSGRALLQDITGRPIAGFVAPAWLYGPEALQALVENEVKIAEDHMKIWSPCSGTVLSRSPVITWASRTRMRRVSSVAAAWALKQMPLRDLRIGVHPGDCRSPQLLRSIEASLRTAAYDRQPARYSDLLARNAN